MYIIGIEDSTEIDKARDHIEKMKKRMKELAPTMVVENPSHST